jgi:hypothetical protein
VRLLFTRTSSYLGMPCGLICNDWDLEDNGVWDDIYNDPKVVADPSTATHRLKHGQLEDGYNKRWQAIVNFGKWITTDESRVAGWYHSVMTIGPEPKLIRTGATLHTVCVTDGPLSTYISCLLEPMVARAMRISIDIIRILLLNSRWYHTV